MCVCVCFSSTEDWTIRKIVCEWVFITKWHLFAVAKPNKSFLFAATIQKYSHFLVYSLRKHTQALRFCGIFTLRCVTFILWRHYLGVIISSNPSIIWMDSSVNYWNECALKRRAWASVSHTSVAHKMLSIAMPLNAYPHFAMWIRR